MARRKTQHANPEKAAKAYDSKEQAAVLGPDIGLQAQCLGLGTTPQRRIGVPLHPFNRACAGMCASG